ncbi:tRNA pseudouridine(38-40) synthase TruA [Salegentibacter sediminis]|uniref:tRNA pseudouridine(38-40) synthase TruA n=1 Tax=Salegentibacter sediminis TaxID=1930251 RepID=UPI0009BE79E5|nr:tRNA pseudouridine(38-40) synthase TruA [Salegentibacter sediminis]
MRYFIELAYFGKNYHGWQNQPDAVSVQEKIETALGKLFQKTIEITGAGRTDAGVHAKQIFAHFDIQEKIDTEQLQYKLNSMLPKDIAVYDIFEVEPLAHARFDALSRSYEYHIINKKDPFLIDRAYFIKKCLDVDKMNQAAEILKTYTNFKCFSKSRTDVKTYNCKIEEARWEWDGDILKFSITANRFLRNMVRAIVGSLIEIGLGKTSVESLHEIIKSEDRSKAGTSVPARALYLTKITYPKIKIAVE